MKNNRLNLLPRIYLMTFMSAFGEGSSAFLIPIFAQSLGGSYVDIGMISAAQSLGFVCVCVCVCVCVLTCKHKPGAQILLDLRIFNEF